MEITINQEAYQVNSASSVLHILTDVLNLPSTGIAVAINHAIVPKAEWESHSLNPGDQIIIIKATQGG
jgi:sulfur carrier protein